MYVAVKGGDKAIEARSACWPKNGAAIPRCRNSASKSRSRWPWRSTG